MSTHKFSFSAFAMIVLLLFTVGFSHLYTQSEIITDSSSESEPAISSTNDNLESAHESYSESEDRESVGSYRLTQGVNGQYTYYCTKICSESCGKSCDTCLMNSESFHHAANCAFSYGASNEIGWVGCPDCGDIGHEAWFEWYRSVLDS